MSFRREKYVPAGGPDGGDGGRGGDVVVVADSTDTTLAGFRDRRRFAAEDGRAGARSNRSGADGATLTLHVPPGTLVRDGSGIVADLDSSGATAILAQGGRGGRGNARFATATRQAPRSGELGAPGERRQLRLELKLIADIGLVGLPNSGKSTLLAQLTGAHPKIAAYAFTTLHPNLGVATLEDGTTAVLADVPGLIEGAHLGAGLGLDFLRHLERTRSLIHLVDATPGPDAARTALLAVDEELREYSPELAARPTIVAFNKIDVAEALATAAELFAEFPRAHPVSAATGAGCSALLEAAARLMARPAVEQVASAAATVAAGDGGHRLYRQRPRPTPAPVVVRDAGGFRVADGRVEQWVEMTDLENDEAVARLQRRLARAGVDRALAAAGCAEGDTVRIGDAEFTFTEGGLGA